MGSEDDHGDEDDRPTFLKRYGLSIGVIIGVAAVGGFLAPLLAPNVSPWRAGAAGAWLGAFGGGYTVLNRLLD